MIKEYLNQHINNLKMKIFKFISLSIAGKISIKKKVSFVKPISKELFLKKNIIFTNYIKITQIIALIYIKLQAIKKKKIIFLDYYSSYELKYFEYLNKIKYYNIKEIEVNLREIYNNNTFSFLLKDILLNNVINNKRFILIYLYNFVFIYLFF